MHEAAVASKLLARVVEVNVTAGQAVSQGDVLVRLEDADLQARLKQAEAALTSAEAQHDILVDNSDNAPAVKSHKEKVLMSLSLS